jgi:uncharacterized protein (DUF4415 family)
MNAKSMRNNYVVYRMDLDNPPPLTGEEKAQLDALKSIRDEDIDFSDIPPLTEEFWRNAKPWRDRHLFRPTKSSTTVRLDSDVLAWLKSNGKGYQTRMNRILRKAMLRERCNRIEKIDVVRHPVINITFTDRMTGEMDFTKFISENAPHMDLLKSPNAFRKIELDTSGQKFGWNLGSDENCIEYTSEFVREHMKDVLTEVSHNAKLAAE